jgi:hypothetical protein
MQPARPETRRPGPPVRREAGDVLDLGRDEPQPRGGPGDVELVRDEREALDQAAVALLGDPQPLGDLDLLGDVGERPDELHGPAAGVPDRRDRHAVGERRAVLADVVHDDDRRAPLLDRRPHGRDGVRLGVGALQEPAVAAEDVGRRVAGQALERGVDVQQRLVVADASATQNATSPSRKTLSMSGRVFWRSHVSGSIHGRVRA